ncbi:2-amino-4-hydroxy-6-hydroxymethyldihydropteridine diphosphokinase [uncultured Bacteroides sp.]|jgi:2-amino-4-hydroxy-6-hydroxymethyldihydropteridine diphosphokinase|uniref:2-amino-4-hydroxy-6- hydroxymethyldihydropteridine diphosphokinase n=1 Tax=uncultured Bacteroides sp. TaxID=162156 RepID=UPI00280BF44B|nr:2-amino-4-hydroxy-6-hydroxymethyldihydropteridine diphosphokinase [uncultured Bacteroides sp.]
MTNRHHCIICLGSNYEASAHMEKACKILDKIFTAIQWGEVIETPSEGGVDKGNYLNRGAILVTDKNPNQIRKDFKTIESQLGRTEEGKKAGIVPIDIDLLKVDGAIIKPADFNKNYVQRVLKSLPHGNGKIH